MSKVLTAAAVVKFKSTGRRREIRDGAATGLYLVIQETGVKSWALRFRRPDGSPAKLTLGPVDLSGREAAGDPEIGAPLTLVGARALAGEVHRQRARGVDVVADHAVEKRKRRAEVVQGPSTFGVLAEEFAREHVMRRLRRPHETARLLGLELTDGKFKVIPNGLADQWGSRHITEVTGHDIYNVTDTAKRRGIPGLGRRNTGSSDARGRKMARTLSKLFAWLVEHRKIATNPCLGQHVPAAPQSRDRVLTDAEIKKFWSACGAVGEPFGSIFRLLLLTGCRLNEVGQMERAELSDDGTMWTIPGNRTKNKRAHIVPLAPMAREIIASVPAVSTVFAFSTNGKGPPSGWSKVKRRLDGLIQIPAWRLHDLRRTAATGMAELGVQPHVIELCLNHVSGARAGVAGIYNRSVQMPERQAALTRWAAHIKSLVAGRPTNVVVPIRK